MGSFADRPAPLQPAQMRMPTDVFEPLLGRTFGELGIEARSMHKCQGTSQLLPLPGASTTRTYLLQDSVIGQPGIAPKSFFEGIDTSLAALTAFAGASPPAALSAGVKRMADAAGAAGRAAALGDRAAAARELAAGLSAVRQLRRDLPAMGLSDEGRFEIDFRLAQKTRQFERALVIAAGLRIEALADDGLVTVGQPVKVSILARSNGSEDITHQPGDVVRLRRQRERLPGRVEAWRELQLRIEGSHRRHAADQRRIGNLAPTRPATTSSRACRSACRSGRRRSPPASI